MASVHAFNLWLDEDWGFDRRYHRILAAPIISLADPDAAKEEVGFVLARGARMVLVRPAPVPGVVKPCSLGDPLHDPVWARLAEAGVPVGFHLSDSGYIAAMWGGKATFRGFRDPRSVGRCIARRPGDSRHHGLADRAPGVHFRHPKLKVAKYRERFVLRVPVDQAAEEGGELQRAPLRRGSPVEQLRNHVWIAPYYEDDVSVLADTIGVDKILSGSDWPDGEGLEDPLNFVNDIPNSPNSAPKMSGRLCGTTQLTCSAATSRPTRRSARVSDWTIGAVLDAVADAVPDLRALVRWLAPRSAAIAVSG